MVKVLVTGSQGFIGSYVCQELLDNGFEVVGVDNYSKYGKVARPHDQHPKFSFYDIDARTICHHTSKFTDVDYIIAGAAMIGGISYFHKYAYDLLATNERIMSSTFDLAIELYKEHHLNKILVLSSSMVFESTTTFPTPESAIKSCPPPLSTYGFQKLSCEYFCKGALEQYELPYTIVRPFNCVGVGEDKALGEEEVRSGNVSMMMSHVLPDLVYKAMRLSSDDALPIFGDGNQIRHYTNGKDIARGIRLALMSMHAINEDFNISSPTATTVKELGEMVWSKIHSSQVQFQHDPPFNYDVQVRSPDVSKSETLLDFWPRISLEESVDEVAEWMAQRLEVYK